MCEPRRTVRFFLCAITRARKACRSREYVSRVNKLSRPMRPDIVALKPVGNPYQSDWVSDHRRLAIERLLRKLINSLRDVMARKRAIRADIVGLHACHVSEHRPADFHRHRVKLLPRSPHPRMTRATLDRIDGGLWQ